MDAVFRIFTQEMKIRGFSQKTQKAYFYYNQKFLWFCRKSPREISNQDVKNYIEYLIDKNLTASSVKLAFNALKFYYTQVIKKRLFYGLVPPKKEQKIPSFLTKEEVQRLLEAIKNQKHRLMAEFIYASGLRVSELVRFRIEDIFVKEKTAMVRQSKGKKDRKIILSETFLQDLRKYLGNRKDGFLFKGRKNHLTERSVQQIISQAARKANITKKIHPHTLRHSFTTHLIKAGVNPCHVQRLLGHSSLKTTQHYVHLSDQEFDKIKSPFDSLGV